MKYVLDSSVAIKIVLPESDSAKATALVGDFQNRVHEYAARSVMLCPAAELVATINCRFDIMRSCG